MSWTIEERDAIVTLLAATCEVTGTELSRVAQDLVLTELGRYEARAVLGSLRRCAAEVRGRLTLADVVTRLDDGRPGVEEAWAMFPKREQDSGCVTEEMSQAWGAASPLCETDEVAARMAWKETYERAIREARASGKPVRWRLSPGWDRAATEAAAVDGYKSGRLSRAEAEEYALPEALDAKPPQLPSPATRALLSKLTRDLSGEKDP